MLFRSRGKITSLEIPLLQGRDFAPQDDATAPKVAIINEAMARFYFGNASAIGKRLSFVSPGGGEIEIIGVVGDAKHAGLREAAPHMLYLPYVQAPAGSGPFDDARNSHCREPGEPGGRCAASDPRGRP